MLDTVLHVEHGNLNRKVCQAIPCPIDRGEVANYFPTSHSERNELMKEFVARPCTTDLYYLGEGCRWDHVRDELYWIDIPTGRFFRAQADNTQINLVRTYELSGDITAVAPLEDRSDGWILASDRSVFLLDEDGMVRELAPPLAIDAPDVRTNDGAADSWGCFWIGTMAPDEAEGRGSLYRYHASTGTELMLTDVTISNGLGWSPDHRTMYYVDSGPGIVHSFDVDDTGRISNKQVIVQFDTTREGTPDGLCVDSQGAIWVAIWGGYEVRRYSPTGQQLARVRVGTAQPSSCAIGGANQTTLYITTAQEGLSAKVLEDEPDAGRLYCVDIGITGLAIDSYCPALRFRN
jgi:sugar lactone lactonase YvrE